MKTTKKVGLGLLLAILGIFFQGSNGFAYEINDKLSIGGIIAGEWQYLSINDAPDFDSEGRGAL
ncbi:MAG: porin, partial [Deltaproteobacteria bacterium]|nr:porin [Deltaproteobacteria bacterium]